MSSHTLWYWVDCSDKPLNESISLDRTCAHCTVWWYLKMCMRQIPVLVFTKKIQYWFRNFWSGTPKSPRGPKNHGEVSGRHTLDCTNKLCTTHSYFHTLVTYFEKKTMMDSDQVITITITLSPQGSWPCCSARWPPPQSSPIGSWHPELPRITLNQINIKVFSLWWICHLYYYCHCVCSDFWLSQYYI